MKENKAKDQVENGVEDRGEEDHLLLLFPEDLLGGVGLTQKSV